MTSSLLLCRNVMTALAISAIAMAAQARTFTVDRFDDVVASACDDSVPSDCSLRGAITAANALPGPDTILLPAGTYTLTVPSTDFEDNNVNGDLDVTDPLTIIGDGADATIVQACAIVPPETTCRGINRVFDIDPGAKGIEVLIRGITIRNGTMAAFADLSGGGLRNRGKLTVVDSIIRDNSSGFSGATGTGGGISNGGTLTLINTLVTNNRTNTLGGGIVNGDFATLILIDSTVSFNTSFQGGGGIFSGFFDVSKPSNTKVLISRSTISNNSGGTDGGGGIFKNRGTLTLTDSTVSNNSVGSRGGGILSGNFDNGPNLLTNCTISGNSSTSGGGIESLGGGGQVILNNCTIANNLVTSVPNAAGSIGGGMFGTFDVANSIIAHNVADTGFGPDCAGTLNSNGHNLIGNQNNCVISGNLVGNIVGADAKLGVLADNGGPTLTQAPAADSPAIDHGNPAPPGSGGSACAAFDQRAFPRPLGAACDMGALERNGSFAITRILPAAGGNAGSVTALVSGGGFAEGSTVKLSRAGQPDIAGSPMQVDEGGSAIAATFDLRGASPGAWNVVVVEPDSTSRTLPNGFIVQAGGGPDLWVDVATFIVPRHDSSRLTIFYGNRGTVDAVAVPLQLSVPSQYGVSALFDIEQPPSQPDQVLTDFSQVPLIVQPVSPNGYTNVPLVLPIVPAGFTGMLQIVLVAPSVPGTGSTLFLNIDTPYFRPTLNPQVVSELVQGALAYAPVGFHVDIAPSLVPFLQQYVSSQLQLVVDRGRSAFVASLGTLPLIYSHSQLQIDAAIVGAVRTLHP